eukprot:Tbor_TRINITY_DN3024_c0_g2::TRINITY_DN3024_c0_g2_i1::g.17382::m.17382
MGCTSSKCSNKSACAKFGDKSKSQASTDELLSYILVGTEVAIANLKDSTEEEKKHVAVAFLNSIHDVSRNLLRLKKDSVDKVIQTVCQNSRLTILGSVVSQTIENCRDDTFCRLLTTYISTNILRKETLTKEQAVNIMNDIDMRFPLPKDEIKFYDVINGVLEFAAEPRLFAVYKKYAGDNASHMSIEGFRTFLIEAQHAESAALKADEKIRNRFGGALTKYTFSLFLGSLFCNGVHDPHRVMSVGQDMTQPLPQYAIHTEIVESEVELIDSLSRGARAVVIHCREENDDVFVGTAKLRDMLMIIASNAFEGPSVYPLVICFAPETQLTLSVQGKIATLLLDIIGEDTLARGMMFEGATMNDPLFSPAALQRKVLILSSQAPLKPFVGFHVADTNKEGLGVRVTNITQCTPAAKAGIIKDDWLTHINGDPINNRDHLKAKLKTLNLGEEFTLKKENLEEIHVVVGGAVVGDSEISKLFSDMVFLKFAPIGGCEVGAAPWDTFVVNSYEDVPSSGNSLGNHFNYTLVGNKDVKKVLGLAFRHGVQFICINRSIQQQLWARAMFSDNAGCGFLHKQENEISGKLRVMMSLVSLPPCIEKEGDIVEIFGEIYGCGSVDHNTSKNNDGDQQLSVDFSDLDDTSVIALFITVRSGSEERKLCTSVRAGIMRSGYRGFVALDVENVGKNAKVVHHRVCMKVALQRT